MSANEKKRKNENGITLIILVVTIIILLILSTVTITTITGQDGMINSVQDQKSETLLMIAKQEVEVAAEKVRVEYASNTLTVSEFSELLQVKLRYNDESATVTADGEKYKVTYNGYTFDYYYN